MEDARRLLAAYDAQLRTDAETAGAVDVATLGPLWLAVFPGGSGFVTYRDLDGADGAGVERLVGAALDRLRADPALRRVEWKTRSHDHAPGLHQALLRHGFVPEEQAALRARLRD